MTEGDVNSVFEREKSLERLSMSTRRMSLERRETGRQAERRGEANKVYLALSFYSQIPDMKGLSLVNSSQR